MKSVGKQLEEARLAKNWTPELAARETKIKVDRVRDLEADDYTHFSSPTYARGFVRTYARALGLDEYRLLRQLDNKLPEDDNATFAQDAGLPYVPEATKVIHASSAHRTGLYVFVGLACAVLLVSAFVLFQAYRAGELPRYFATGSSLDSEMTSGTNAVPAPDAEAPPHAVAVDPNDTTHSVRALPVDLNNPSNTNTAPLSPAAPVAATAPATPAETDGPVPGAHRALPVDLSALGNAAPAAGPTSTPPTAADSSTPSPTDHSATSTSSPVPASGPSAAPPADAAPVTDTNAPPRALPVDPRELVAGSSATNPVVQAAQNGTPPADNPAPGSSTNADGIVVTPVDLAGDRPVQESMAEAQAKKRLILTASRDSFIRVTSLDAAQGNEILYASVLRAGQSLAFGGHKFSVNVGIPSAVDIALDGVNYGPHSDGNSPETFTLESHQP
jgi:cytoskeleton protein RodZ